MSGPLQHAINLGSRGAAERPGKRATEVVAEERVEDGVDGAVGVAEDGDQLIEDHQPSWHAADVQHDDLEQPVRQPAKHIYRDYGQHHPRHLSSRLLLTCNKQWKEKLRSRRTDRARNISTRENRAVITKTSQLNEREFLMRRLHKTSSL